MKLVTELSSVDYSLLGDLKSSEDHNNNRDL